jgi:hypothetical protein
MDAPLRMVDHFYALGYTHTQWEHRPGMPLGERATDENSILVTRTYLWTGVGRIFYNGVDMAKRFERKDEVDAAYREMWVNPDLREATKTRLVVFSMRLMEDMDGRPPGWSATLSPRAHDVLDRNLG